MTITNVSVADYINRGNYADIIAIIDGTAPGGAYKIPVRMMYPTSSPSGVCVCEAVNSVDTEQGLSPFMYEIVRSYAGDDWICDTEKMSYIAFEWNKFAAEAYTGGSPLFFPHRTPGLAGGVDAPRTPADAYAIAAGEDAWTIMADMGAWSKAPSFDSNTPAAPAFPTATKAIVTGFSQTGSLVREFMMSNHNSATGNQFEGALSCVAGGMGHVQNNASVGYVDYILREGASDAGEGLHISLQTETDVVGNGGAKARAAVPVNHYKQLEIAGLSHIPQFFFDLGFVGQNDPLLFGPIKAMLKVMKTAVLADSSLADQGLEDAHMEGTIATRSEILWAQSAFAGGSGPGVMPQTNVQSWFGSTLEAFNLELGSDGNALGGLRMPYLRTLTEDGEEVGAPTAYRRGFRRFGAGVTQESILAADAAEQVPSFFPRYLGWENYFMTGGYEDLYEDLLLRRLYASNAEYVGKVGAGADYAIRKGWLLDEDRDAFVSAAVASGIGAR